MAITGINNSSYTSYYASNYKNTVKKTDSEKDSTNTKDGNVTTSTVELKTSRPGVTKTEQIKTGYSNVNDYSKYLQGKYHYMNIGLTSMQGIPTTVSVSSAFLQKCMNDPEKAKYLEENLAAIPDCTKDTINGCLGTVTNQSYMIDANGNIIETVSGTNDPDGKIAKENAERKAKENREKEKKVKEKRAAKKAEEEKAAKKRAEKSAERKVIKDFYNESFIIHISAFNCHRNLRLQFRQRGSETSEYHLYDDGRPYYASYVMLRRTSPSDSQHGQNC